MLRLVGEGAGPGGQAGPSGPVQSLYYAPGVANSGDLEPGTKAITNTSRPASPQYSTTLVVPAPPQGIAVLRLCLRLWFNIASNSSDYAFYSVVANGTEVLSSSTSYNATGQQGNAVDLTLSPLVLGSPNQIDIYFWCFNGNGYNLDGVRCFLGVGSRRTYTSLEGAALRVDWQGWASVTALLKREGSGTPYLHLAPAADFRLWWQRVSGDGACLEVPAVLADGLLLVCYGTYDRDLNYIERVQVTFLQ